MSPRSSEPDIDYGRVGLISAGHLTNDLYGNLLTSLTPYLVIRGAITTSVAGLILLLYLLGSSVLQPLFGIISDRSERKLFAALGPLWIGLAASLVGWVGNGPALLAVAALGGIGTAGFHPQAASMVDRLSRRSKGWAMAIFSVGGNIGFALGPVAAATIATVGLRWTPIILLPGVIMALLLLRYAPSPMSDELPPNWAAVRQSLAHSWRPLLLIVGIIAIRSGAQYGLIIFLPLYYHAHGLPAQLGSYGAFALSLSGALGGLAGGRLSDRYGRNKIVVGSLLLSAPLIALALLTFTPAVWPLIILGGAALLASNSVTVVQGQELLPASTGIAAGITMGLGFGLSGVIASALGTLADHVGVTAAIMFVPGLPVAAAALAALFPTPRAGTSARSEAAG